MTRMLILAMHRPRRSPGQRFRFEQYLDYLQANGLNCDLSYPRPTTGCFTRPAATTFISAKP